MSSAKDENLDEVLYSRQIMSIGIDAMKRILKSKAVIIGLGGVGLEVAKNIILSGIKNVNIIDDKNCTMEDLASQFYLTEKDIGKNRAECCIKALQELNPSSNVTFSKDVFNMDFIDKVDPDSTVVITEMIPNMFGISEKLHKRNIKHIITLANGVFGFMFVDAGEEFTSLDPKGEPPVEFYIMGITKGKDGLVDVYRNERHGLSDGDVVTFKEVDGMTEVNGKEFVVKCNNVSSFFIGDTSSFGDYTINGICKQVIKPAKFNFSDLRKALKNGKVADFDFVNDRQILLAFVAYSQNSKDFINEARKLNDELKLVDSVDEKILNEFNRTANVVISPVASAVGGIIAQEVIKLCTCKFTPIMQAVSINFLSALPSDIKYEKASDRYDPYRRVFGNQLAEKVRNLSYFMIGAGALGCEYAKLFAMMGLGTGEKGLLTITDNDVIEKSNLSRQFLFRDSNIGQPKSQCVAESVMKMNPSMKIKSYKMLLIQQNRDTFNDAFYSSLDGVCNALDNITARIYSDSLAGQFSKPLIDAGTEGTKGNVFVVVPHMSENYGHVIEQDKFEGAHVCSIHGIPSKFLHCAHWGLVEFNSLFTTPSNSVNKLYDDPQFADIKEFTTSNVEIINAAAIAILFRPENFRDCVALAKHAYQHDLYGNVETILRSRKEFSGVNRKPVLIPLDIKDPTTFEFISSAAFIYAYIFGIKPELDKIPEYIGACKEITFKKASEIDEVKALYAKIKAIPKQPVKVVDFDKDNEEQMHPSFVSAAANLRARFFNIEEQPKIEAIRIAGNIIPALATTTAAVCGIAAMEIYKLHSAEKKPLDAYKNTWIMLASGSVTACEPCPASKTKISSTGGEFTFFDTVFYDHKLKVKELMKVIEEQYKCSVYAMAFDRFSVNTNQDATIGDVIRKRVTAAPGTSIELSVNCEDSNGEDIDIPRVVIKF